MTNIYYCFVDPEKYERKLNELRGAIKQAPNTSVSGTATDMEASSASNSFKWTTNNIKLMLQERLDMEPQFVNPKCKKVKLWGKIANKMQEAGYHRIGGHDCNTKYRNLLQTYKQNKEKRSKTGDSKITWEYFEMFDNVLGTKPSIIPDKNLLSTSIESEISDQSDPETELEAVKDDHKEEKLPKVMRKRKLCKELPVTQYLYLKEKRHVEDREFAVKKWDETKQLKKDEISAINNLAQAIMEATKSRKTE